MITLNCEYCNKQFKKYPKDAKRAKHHYCSRVCSNRGQPRKPPAKRCPDCNKKIKRNSDRCKLCCHTYRSSLTDEKTISEVIKKYGQPSNRYTVIRDRSYSLYHHLRSHGCQNCKYSLHVDICHIKDIKDFTQDTKIKFVNAASNITLLCKNCHWEFDNGLLNKTISTVEKWCTEEESNL